MATKLNFNVFRGDTFKKTLKFTDENGNPIDITGWTVYFTVKKPAYVPDDSDDSEALKQIIINVASGTSGVCTISWENVDISPFEYAYDIQIKKATGEVLTMLYGKFIVEADVTRTV